MSDDNSRGSSDRMRITLNQPYQVRAWTLNLQCTEPHLREAIKAVGHSADAVRRYLAARRSQP